MGSEDILKALEKSIDGWQEDKEFFVKNRKDIGKKYGKETYVAVYQKKIVDQDKDERALIERVNKKYEGKSLFIASPESYITIKEAAKVVKIRGPKKKDLKGTWFD